MELTSIAKPYVNALLDLSAKANSRDEWLVFLRALSNLSTDAHIKLANQSPKVSPNQQQVLFYFLLEKMLVTSLTIEQKNFVNLIIKNNRLNIIVAIYQLFYENSRADNSLIGIQSAYDLSDTDLTLLNKKMSDKHQKEVVLDVQTNPDLLGGIIIKQGDRVINNSIKAKFEELSALLSVNQQ